MKGRVEVVKLLLSDSRLNSINKEDNEVKDSSHRPCLTFNMSSVMVAISLCSSGSVC